MSRPPLHGSRRAQVLEVTPRSHAGQPQFTGELTRGVVVGGLPQEAGDRFEGVGSETLGRRGSGVSNQGGEDPVEFSLLDRGVVGRGRREHSARPWTC